MAKTTNYGARLELRVSSKLKINFESFCREYSRKRSDALRDALQDYMMKATLRERLLTHLQEQRFYMHFKDFYGKIPNDLKQVFEDFLGPEEETLVKETPMQLLGALRVITERGIKALKIRAKLT